MAVMTKEWLTQQMGSKDNVLARQAVEELRARGWLEDGSLQGAALSNADLQRALLLRADLREADMRGANLQEAVLHSAKLQESNLRAADLQGATLWGADLQGANLAEANLQGTNLSGADLRGANLASANLQKAILAASDLRGASNLSDKQLSQANEMRHAKMPDGSRYDGRFNLAGDIEWMRTKGTDTDDPAGMARFYGVSLEAYHRVSNGSGEAVKS